MALFGIFLNNPFSSFLTVSIAVVLSQCFYRVFFHPLAHIPGPFLPKITSLWLHYHTYIGDEPTLVHKAHQKYGPLVRVSPNEIDISDADAIAPIYVSKGGFPKAPCYANFDIEGHKTLFSTTDMEYRAPRAKAVVPMFSTKNIRDNEVALYGCMDRMVHRMQEEAKTGKPVNVLNLSRSLALDAISTHLFQENYNGTSEKGNRLSASAFVDAVVSFGRFFNLPKWAFEWALWLVEKLILDEQTFISMEIVDKFVDRLVDSTPEGAQTYPGRLITLGLEKSEVISQCKDLIFAGTDSTGMNIARICHELVLHPEKYEILRSEITSNAHAGLARQEVQSLPYLSGVIKEVLRIAMANPTRLPHIVPADGWTFKTTHIPSGSIVGCSAFELHYNPIAFPNPYDFQPERWLEENITAEANKYWFAFGAGSRACIARNLATTELFMATERLVESDVLRGARVCQEKIEIYEWFNSMVKGEKIELVWGKEVSRPRGGRDEEKS